MSYAIGDAEVIAWIRESTTTGLSIGAAIPPGFESYATVVIPDDDRDRLEHDRTLIELLRQYSPESSWWLGYLETGGDPIPFPDAPKVGLYAGWKYVLAHAGPDEALSLRDGHWGRTLPELLFPDDRSWLVSTLWDDDWRCVGGPANLIGSMVDATALETRVVDFTQDATPLGHIAY